MVLSQSVSTPPTAVVASSNPGENYPNVHDDDEEMFVNESLSAPSSARPISTNITTQHPTSHAMRKGSLKLTLASSLFKHRIFLNDFDTTGLDSFAHRIVQVAVMRYEPNCGLVNGGLDQL